MPPGGPPGGLRCSTLNRNPAQPDLSKGPSSYPSYISHVVILPVFLSNNFFPRFGPSNLRYLVLFGTGSKNRLILSPVDP